ncbi:MAG: hypothetical protein DWP97_13230 [Calditrichaeota bacterium]|nr:MAG: hypothetical protein DWP97_13230 [Calditrichota bacterium]
MLKLIPFVISLFVILSGCSGGYQSIAEEESIENNIKINADAYLFDAKVIQNGKPTSVRLYFYQTDSIIGIGGRGYLGKGALKGWITADSIKVMFPTTKEYLFESVSDLFSSFACADDIPEFELMSLFSVLPDRLFADSIITVNRVDDDTDDKRREYMITIEGCLWNLYLRYDYRDDRFVIRNFEFDDGKTTTLSGKRREYKTDQNIKLAKFKVPLSPEYIRIIP